MIKKVIASIRKRIKSPEEYGRSIGVKIGKGCYISTKNYSSEPYLISIGDNVRVANNVRFFTHGGLWPYRKQYPGLEVFGKITIGNNVYIGEGVHLMPGIEIGDNCVIGAASVVTKSIPEGTIAAGNPIRYIGKMDKYLEKMNKMSVNKKFKSPEEREKFLTSLPDDKFIKKPFLKIE